MDVAKGAPLGLLHYHLNSLVVAFKVPFHSPEHPCLGSDRIQLCEDFPLFQCQVIPALAAGILTQGVACDGIIGGSDLFPGFAQFFSGRIQIHLCLMTAHCTGGQIAAQLLQSFPGLQHAFLQAPAVGLPAGNICRQTGFLSPQFQELLGQTLGAGRHGGQLLLQLKQGFLLCAQGGLDLPDPFFRLGDLGHDAAGAVLLAQEFLLNPGNIGIIVLPVAVEDCHLTVQLLLNTSQHIDLHADGFQFSIPTAQGFSQSFCLAVQLFQIVMGLLQNKGCRLIVLLRLFGRSGQLLQGVQPYGYFHTLQLTLQLQIFLRFLGLLLERLQLQLQLGDLVADAQQIVLGMHKLALGLFLAVAVFGNTRRFLEDFPSVAAL